MAVIGKKLSEPQVCVCVCLCLLLIMIGKDNRCSVLVCRNQSSFKLSIHYFLDVIPLSPSALCIYFMIYMLYNHHANG